MSGHGTERHSEDHSLSEDGKGGHLLRYRKNGPSEEHSLTRDGRGRHLSGYGKGTKKVPLTNWWWQREGCHGTKMETD